MTKQKPKPGPEPTPAVELAPEPAAPPVGDAAPADTRPDGPPAAADAGGPPAPGPRPFVVRSDATTGVALREDRRFRQVQLQFADKPSDAVRMLVRQAGFAWQPADRVWVKPIDREAGWKTRLDAERLFGEVVEQVAHERGAAQSR